MKSVTIILASLLFSAVIALAQVSDDPLLDARIEVVTLRLHYTDKHPKMIEAQTRLNFLSKTYSESRANYRAHIQERITEAEVEEAVLRTRYTDKHPKWVANEATLAFLREELQRAKKRSFKLSYTPALSSNSRSTFSASKYSFATSNAARQWAA
jgi:hypothetical protein